MDDGAPLSPDHDDRPIVRIWRHDHFRNFMLGIGPYYVTSWMQRVGIAWLAWELSHSTAWLGLVAAADLGPMILIAPFAGAYVDRADPIRIIRVCMAFMMFQALLLAILTATGAISIHLLFVLSLITGCVQPIYSAARQTLVPLMVPREDFATGVALDSSFFHGSRFLGPSIAALTIPWLGVQSNFVAHIFGTGLFQFMLWRLKFAPPDRSHRRRSSLITDTKAGIAYVRTHDGLLPVFVLVTVVSTAIRPVQEMLSGFAGSVFHWGPVGLAWLTSSLGMGAMVSAVLLAVRGQSSGLTHKVFFSSLGLAVATLAFVATNVFWVAVVAGFLIGYTLNSVSTGSQTLTQIAVSDDMRGRVSGLYSVVYRGMPAIGALVTGVLAEWIGLRWCFAIASLIGLSTFVIFLPRIGEIAEELEAGPRR